jgi:hypothetical protein
MMQVMIMAPQYVVICYEVATPERWRTVFKSSLIVEAAHKMARLSDLAPGHVRYQLVRTPR